MPYERGKEFTTRIEKDAKDELTRLAQSFGMKEVYIVSHAVMNVAPMRMLEDDWEARKKALDEVHTPANRYDFLDDPCVALGYIDDHWACTWGRVGNTPNTKKLGVSEEAVTVRCGACQKTLELSERLVTAEMKLAQGIVVDIPSCEKGGRLLNDGKKIMCLDPQKSAMPRDVHKFCKISKSGGNCDHLRWSKVELKGKQFELDKKSV